MTYLQLPCNAGKEKPEQIQRRLVPLTAYAVVLGC